MSQVSSLGSVACLSESFRVRVSFLKACSIKQRVLRESEVGDIWEIWALKRAKNSEAILLSPFTLTAEPNPGLSSLLERTAEGKSRARPPKPSQTRQAAARTAPPIGALLWEVSHVGFQSIPAAGSVAARPQL